MKQRTVRELGGEIARELVMQLWLGDRKMARLIDNLEGFNGAIDLVMGVLARHDGKVIKNDHNLPVTPLSRLKHGEKRANKAIANLLSKRRR